MPKQRVCKHVKRPQLKIAEGKMQHISVTDRQTDGQLERMTNG